MRGKPGEFHAPPRHATITTSAAWPPFTREDLDEAAAGQLG
jgi:hypothetical protein